MLHAALLGTLLATAQDPEVLVHTLLTGDAAAVATAGTRLLELGEPCLPALGAARAKAADAEAIRRLDAAIGGIEIAHVGPLTLAFTRGGDGRGAVWTWQDGVERQLAADDGHLPAQVALSPDGTRVAWAVATGGKTDWSGYEVRVAPVRGGDAKVLGPGLAPQWSADGTVVHALRERLLLAYRADGKDQRQLAELPGVAYELEASGDGRRLCAAAGGALHVFEAATGKAVARIPALPGDTHTLSGFGASMDGRSFVLVAGDGPYRWDVYLADPAGKHTRLTAASFTHGVAALSPDGRQVAFTTDTSTGERGAPRRTSLRVVDCATRGERTLHAGVDPVLRPSWSPDARFLVFVDDHGDATLLHVATGASRKLTALQVLYGPVHTWFAPSVHFGAAR